MLFCDPRVSFRSRDALADLARAIEEADGAALAGEFRPDDRSDPVIDEVFFAVRRDVYRRRNIQPLISQDSPAARLQQSVMREPGLVVVDFPSIAGGHILFPPQMRVTSQPALSSNDSHLELLLPEHEPELLRHLSTRLSEGLQPRDEDLAELPRPDLPTFEPTTKLRRSPNVLLRENLTTAVVLVPPQEPMALSGTARLIWSVFEQPTTTDEAVALLADILDVPIAIVAADVSAVVDRLTTSGALVPTQ